MRLSKLTILLTILSLATFLSSDVFAGSLKTIAFLEEHHIEPGTFPELGGRYTVPPGKKATVTTFFCEVMAPREQNNVQVSIFMAPANGATIRGPRTPWLGTNPLSCSNAVGKPTALTQAGPVIMLPGDYMQTFFTNMSDQQVFVMLGAWIVESDL